MNAVTADLTDLRNRAARETAFAKVADDRVGVTGLVSYHSAGRLLIIGPDPEAIARLAASASPLRPAVLLLAAGTGAVAGLTTWRASREQVALGGWLGDFRLGLSGAGSGEERFDLVLDLCDPPLVQAGLPPPGYSAPGAAGEGPGGGPGGAPGPDRGVREAALFRVRPKHLRARDEGDHRLSALHRRLPGRGHHQSRGPGARGGQPLPGRGSLRNRLPDRGHHLRLPAGRGPARADPPPAGRIPGGRRGGPRARSPRYGCRS